MTMRIQINAQTRDGVWGYFVTVWQDATCVTSEWFATLPSLPEAA